MTGAGRLVILASGSGSNAQALMQACADGALDASVVAIVTNNAAAGVLQRAERFDVSTVVVEHRGSDPERRAQADARLIDVISDLSPDIVILAGWMRILGAEVGAAFPIVNLHPASPGAFPGIDAIRRAWQAHQAGEVVGSGVMVHWVPDQGVDVGPVIVTETVPIHDADAFEDFETRMHETEHRLIVEGARRALDEVRGASPRD